MKMLQNLSTSSSVFNIYLSEIRDIETQKDPLRFRRNLERLAEIMAYEISKTLDYTPHSVTTPLGISQTEKLVEQPVLATILRAGLAMHQGFLNVFDRAGSAFVSAYRKTISKDDFVIYEGYTTAPPISDRVLIVSDPMLATGASMKTAYEALLKYGTPKRLIVCAAIASQQAVEYLKENLPENLELYVGAIDPELTPKSYIVPGLGDAGDLAYGEKL